MSDALLSIPNIEESKFKAFLRWEILRLSKYTAADGSSRNDASDMATLLNGLSTEEKFKIAMFAIYNESLTLHQAAAAASSGVTIDDYSLKPLYLRDYIMDFDGSGYKSEDDVKTQMKIIASSLTAFEKTYLDFRAGYLKTSLTNETYSSYLMCFGRIFGEHSEIETNDVGFIKVADDLVQEHTLKSMLRSKGGISTMPALPQRGYMYKLLTDLTKGDLVVTKFVYKDAPTITLSNDLMKEGNTLIYDPYYVSGVADPIERWIYLESGQNIQPLTRILKKLKDFGER